MRTIPAAGALAALLAMPFAAPSGEPQPEPSDWREATISARAWHAMAWDARGEHVLLFGGNNAAGQLGDTWAWDGANWGKLTSEGPPPRSFHAMASDPVRGRIVLFGGLDGDWARLGDTWEWDGTRWEEITTTDPAPSPRAGHAMAWDPVSGQVLLFGGRDSDDEDARRSAGTWLWNGESWALTAAPGPPGRSGHALATDPVREHVVLFGGMDPDSTDDGASWRAAWEWNGGNWRTFAPTGEPSARSGHALGWDANRQRIVLLGGRSDEAGAIPGTWEWDGEAWQEAPAPTGPSPRTGHAMEWDPVRGQLVLFGGSDEGPPEHFHGDTWLLGGNGPRPENKNGPGANPEPEVESD